MIKLLFTSSKTKPIIQHLDWFGSTNLLKVEDNKIRREKVLSIPKLVDLHSDSNLGIFKTYKSLRFNSIFLDPVQYIQLIKLLSFIPQDLKDRLMIRQKDRCPICDKKLIDLSSLLAWETKIIDNTPFLFLT